MGILQLKPKLNMAKIAFVLFFVVCLAFLHAEAASSPAARYQAIVKAHQDDCLVCAADIVDAVAKCAGEDMDILTCNSDILGAGSGCLKCICEILEIIGGFDNVCPDRA